MIIQHSIFVDTSGWARYLNRLDPLLAEAAQAFKQAIGQGSALVTTNYVLSELVPLMSVRMRISRHDILAAVDRIRQLQFLAIVHIDETQDQAAWAMLRRHLDKEWSLVDAASFVVMQSLGITSALTTDHHFEQAGYLRLLQP